MNTGASNNLLLFTLRNTLKLKQAYRIDIQTNITCVAAMQGYFFLAG